MNKLITHVPAGEVSADFQSAAAAWPLWDSTTHPQKPKKSGKFLFDYSECRQCARAPLFVSCSVRATPPLTHHPATPPPRHPAFRRRLRH